MSPQTVDCVGKHRWAKGSKWLLAAMAISIGTIATGYSAGLAVRLHTCPHCQTQCTPKICEPTPSTDKEKKHCWCIETKEVCIPHIRFPWQPCCEPPKCGRVRTVKTLKKVEYECEKCGYKWEIKCASCSP